MGDLALIMAVAHIAAAIALLNGLLTTFGQARIAAQAIESMGDNQKQQMIFVQQCLSV